jgi:hypothetical protein
MKKNYYPENKMRNKYIGLITLLSCIYLTVLQKANVSLAQTDQQKDETGIIGILYDDVDFKRPGSVWTLPSLNSAEAKWPKNKDFSAQWQGNIEGPADAEITFFSEADNGVRLEVDGNVILDSWAAEPISQGNVEMKTGKRYAILLRYRQISGPSYMRIFWTWPGQQKETVPSSFLHFTVEDKTSVQEIFRNEVDLPAEELTFNIASILTIKNAADVESRRQAFSRFLFGKEGIPLQKGIDLIDRGIQDDDFKDLPNLKAIDRLTLNMDFGLTSIAYHFIPLTSNNKVVIYHQGHDGEFSLGITTIHGLLSKGYHVVGLAMPLKGMNSQPVVYLNRFGKMNINTHERIGFLEPAQGHPVQYFVEPVFRVINYLQTQGFNQVQMTGISGGGWTTTLCAAMDTRIQRSYPVAGSLPIYLRIRDPKNGSWGDYEQVVPELYRIANYLELYVLGASGPGRRQVQMLNEFDSCCFSGTGFKSYRFLVQERVKSIGQGHYDIFLDSTHEEHKISEVALDFILNDLEK